MATGSTGSLGQMYHTNQVHYISRAITYADNGAGALTVGVIPPGALVIRGGVVVHTAFNGNSSNVLDIGTSGDDDGFATDLALGTIGVISADEMASTNDMVSTSDITVTCTVVSTASASAGVGTVWVEYIIPAAAR